MSNQTGLGDRYSLSVVGRFQVCDCLTVGNSLSFDMVCSEGFAEGDFGLGFRALDLGRDCVQVSLLSDYTFKELG